MKGWLFALLFLSGTAQGQEHPAWFAQSLLVLPEEIADAARENKRVMLYFEQDGCPYCKRMVDVTFRNPKISGLTCVLGPAAEQPEVRVEHAVAHFGAGRLGVPALGRAARLCAGLLGLR